ncbi:MAG: type II secretion system F family protein [Candidatus Bathyarchaeota archaeon]|nr:type II secretion system F family protein [Candidatus Bathyarchaeota archaeon]
MTTSKMRKRLKRAYHRVKNALSVLFFPITSVFSQWIESLKLGATKPQVFAYQLVGGRATRFLPLFKDLDVNLKKSGIKINFKAYVSTVILASLLLSTSIMIFVPVFLFFIFKLSLFLSLLFGVGVSLFAGALTVIGFYFYPTYRADSLKRALEDEMPFTIGYMSILAGAGVPPDFIWRSLAQIDSSLSISNVARTVVRDVELFGFDAISALETTSKRTPSERFKEMLEGFISVVHSGGNLVKYLRDRSQQYMKLKQIALRRFSDTLGVLAEFYVTLMVAGVLIFVVMLAVMAMLGSGGFGPLDSRLLLQLLTYIGLPIGSVVFLVILDMVSPKR